MKIAATVFETKIHTITKLDTAIPVSILEVPKQIFAEVAQNELLEMEIVTFPAMRKRIHPLINPIKTA